MCQVAISTPWGRSGRAPTFAPSAIAAERWALARPPSLTCLLSTLQQTPTQNLSHPPRPRAGLRHSQNRNFGRPWRRPRAPKRETNKIHNTKSTTARLFYFMTIGLILTPSPSNPRIRAVFSACGALWALRAHSGFAAHPKTIQTKLAATFVFYALLQTPPVSRDDVTTPY